MSDGQRKVRDKAIQQRAARKGERQQRRRRSRAVRSGAVVATTALGLAGLAGLAATSAHAADPDPRLVADINTGSGSSSPGPKVAIGNTMYFAADNGNGSELWKSDGTTAGTTLVKDIFPGSYTYEGNGETYTYPNSSSPRDLTAVGSTLYFTAESSGEGRELWKSDGTPGGTVLVKDIDPGDYGSSPYSLTVAGSTLYFSADDSTNGRELWKSNDGTPAGTVMVTDLSPGTESYYDYDTGSYVDMPASSSPYSLSGVGTTLYFSAESDDGRGLWKSDGTPTGTTLIKDIRLSGDMAIVGDTLFFSAADNAEHGRELWKSDGTTAGTTLVKDINPNTESYGSGEYTYTYGEGSNPRDLHPHASALYFTADDGANGRELWRSDGTAAGTTLVKDISPGTETYTDEGTTNTYPSSSSPRSLTSVGNTIFFSARTVAADRELWKSDGTATGTTMVKDISASGSGLGGYSYYDSELVPIGNTLYFAGNSDTAGNELWGSNGTAAGTTMVKDLYPGTYSYTADGHTYTGPYSSSPSYLLALGQTLYFSADQPGLGEELWALPAVAATVPGGNATPVPSAACTVTEAAVADAQAKVKKAKSKLKLAKKKDKPAKKIKKLKTKVKKAKGKLKKARAADTAACG